LDGCNEAVEVAYENSLDVLERVRTCARPADAQLEELIIPFRVFLITGVELDILNRVRFLNLKRPPC